MKTTRKRLSLHRETLRTLEGVGGARGGSDVTIIVFGCDSQPSCHCTDMQGTCRTCGPSCPNTMCTNCGSQSFPLWKCL